MNRLLQLLAAAVTAGVLAWAWGAIIVSGLGMAFISGFF